MLVFSKIKVSSVGKTVLEYFNIHEVNPAIFNH